MNSFPRRPDLTAGLCTFGFLGCREKVCGCEVVNGNGGALSPKMNSLIGRGRLALLLLRCASALLLLRFSLSLSLSFSLSLSLSSLFSLFLSLGLLATFAFCFCYFCSLALLLALLCFALLAFLGLYLSKNSSLRPPISVHYFAATDQLTNTKKT